MRLPSEALKATQLADSEPENYRGSNDYSCVHDDSPLFPNVKRVRHCKRPCAAMTAGDSPARQRHRPGG